ncbi:MAG: tetratricopeptide repeat protein [Candidatus Gastranaerophilales bacterium]|nr:tetratricopeptide repeat protein [Candidatus Gastranaerophilales bacterium]
MNKKIILLFIIFLISGFFSFSFCAAENEEISEEDMQQAIAAYKHGVEMVRVKAYDTAISSFQKALTFYPKMTDAYYNIASIYIAQKKFDEAYNAYVKIIAINPYDYDSILQAAKISYNRKNYSLAMKYLKYIPDDYDYYYVVQQLYNDAKTQFDAQRNKVERSKVTTANNNKRVLIDKFNSPAGMAVDSEGNMFVACYSDNSIVKVDKNKNKTNFVKDYLLDGPIGIAIDNYDNIYVANFEADNILKVTKGGNISVFMDNVSKPYFLYIKDDILYISEQGNDVVLEYNLSTAR